MTPGRALGGPGVAVGIIRTDSNPEVRRWLKPDTLHPVRLGRPINSNRHSPARMGSAATGAAFRDAWTFSTLDKACIAHGRPATGQEQGFTDYGHDPEQGDGVPLMAEPSGVTRALPARCATARTWAAHRLRHPAPPFALFFSPQCRKEPSRKEPSMEVAVLQVLYDQL